MREERFSRLGDDPSHRTNPCIHLPSVAVVVPCFNAEQWIGRAIRSALGQNYSRIEVIAIDDGSTDDSLEVIKSFGNKIRWKTVANRGACAARNMGLALSSADYVVFLDGDDYYEGELISGAIETATATDADIVFCPFQFEHPDGRGRQCPATPTDGDPVRIFADWIEGRFVASMSVVWRTAFVKALGGWDETLVRNQDGDLALRGLLHGARTALSTKGTGIYNKHGSPTQISANKSRQALLSTFTSLNNLWQKIEGTAFEQTRPSFGPAYYDLARACYGLSYEDVACAALQRARQAGLRGHIGSPLHRTGAMLLGLKAKERIATWLNKLRHTAWNGE